tara:strand:- start:554 stop:838 length:285 start_codon:yes stop_codon:yes gene_type:complete
MSKHLGVDGFPRPNEEDQKISLDLLATFNTPSGKSTLQYLKSITIEAISGGAISNDELRHMEGQRYLVAMIVKRINHAERIKNGRASTAIRNTG